MNESDVANENKSTRDESSLSGIAPKLWYQNKRTWILGFLALAAAVFWYMFYRPIEVTRGPWQMLDPGQPVEPLKFEVVEEGSGAVVEPGDLIQVSLWWWSNKENRLERRDDDWWIWVGFRTKEETPFYSINPRLISAFVGLKEGGGVKFLEKQLSHRLYAEVYLNPFGYSGYFRSVWREGMGNFKWGAIYFPYNSGHTVVHIKKVFKGQLRYRTTYVYDGTWFHHCYNFLECKFSNTPRDGWYDNARYDGVSADGQVATFQFGPVANLGKKWSGPNMTFSVDWVGNEWKSLPVSVQVK